jgi:hypothetical protein
VPLVTGRLAFLFASKPLDGRLRGCNAIRIESCHHKDDIRLQVTTCEHQSKASNRFPHNKLSLLRSACYCGKLAARVSSEAVPIGKETTEATRGNT